MTTTARSTPSGTKLENGFSTKIAFAADADVSLWEIGVKPPGIDGGDSVGQSTMHNTTWETKSPGALLDLSESTFQAAYDPAVYDQIVALVNVNGWITVHFPDDSTLDFVGYLKTFDPQELTKNGRPVANVTIVPTNHLSGVETAPDYTAPV